MTLKTYTFGALILLLGVIGIYMVFARYESYPLLTVFFYSISTNAAMAIFPHEPVIIMYGKVINLWRLSASATLGTIVAAFLDYHFFAPVLNLPYSVKYKSRKSYQKAQGLFCKFPFWAIAFGCFLPLPFYPFKFLAFSSKYPLSRYIVAVATGRFPRYFLLGLAGWAFPIPNWAIFGFSVLFFAILYYKKIYGFFRGFALALARLLGLKTISGRPGR